MRSHFSRKRAEHARKLSDADPALLQEIRRAAERTSPMYDNIANGAAIRSEVAFA